MEKGLIRPTPRCGGLADCLRIGLSSAFLAQLLWSFGLFGPKWIYASQVTAKDWALKETGMLYLQSLPI